MVNANQLDWIESATEGAMAACESTPVLLVGSLVAGAIALGLTQNQTIGAGVAVVGCTFAEVRQLRTLGKARYAVDFGAAPVAMSDEQELRDYAEQMGAQATAEQLLQAAQGGMNLNSVGWDFLEDFYGKQELDKLLEVPLPEQKAKRFHLIEPIVISPTATTPAANPGQPPQTVEELLQRLKAECPAFLKLVKAPPIRLVGAQRTGKSSFGRKLALLRAALLPGHTVAWATPHREQDNPVPPALHPFGVGADQGKDMRAIEAGWGLAQAAIDRGNQLNATIGWDEFGSYDEFQSKEVLGGNLKALLRDSTKHEYYPILVVHGDQASFYPGVKGIFTTVQQSTVKVETIGEQADDFGNMKPTGEVEITWLDGSQVRFKLPEWLTVDLLLKLQPENTKPAFLDQLPPPATIAPPKPVEQEPAATQLQDQGLMFQPIQPPQVSENLHEPIAVPSNVATLPQNPLKLQFERVKQQIAGHADFEGQLKEYYPVIKKLLQESRRDLITLALFSMEHGAVKAREVYNKAPNRRKLFHPIKVEGIRQLFEDLESRGMGEVIGDDSEAFYRAFFRDDRSISANSNLEESEIA